MLHADGRHQVRLSLTVPGLLHEDGGQVGAHIAAVGDGDGVTEEGLAVVPESDLPYCEGRESGQREGSCSGNNAPAGRAAFSPFGDRPDDTQRDAHRGNEGEAVGHRLAACLD